MLAEATAGEEFQERRQAVLRKTSTAAPFSADTAVCSVVVYAAIGGPYPRSGRSMFHGDDVALLCDRSGHGRIRREPVSARLGIQKWRLFRLPVGGCVLRECQSP
jgi:hypothetical protein